MFNINKIPVFVNNTFVTFNTLKQVRYGMCWFRAHKNRRGIRQSVPLAFNLRSYFFGAISLPVRDFLEAHQRAHCSVPLACQQRNVPVFACLCCFCFGHVAGINA